MYTEKIGNLAIVPNGTGVLGVETLSASAAVHGEYLVMERVKALKFMFCVTVAVAAATTAPVVRVLRRPTPGSTSGQEVIATLTIPTGTAVGKVLYKLIDSSSFQVGDAIAFEHTVQAADPGTAAGAGFYGLDLVHDPEYVGEEADMILSV